MKLVSFAAFIMFWSVTGTLYALSLLVPVGSPASAEEPVFSLQDIARHNTLSDCWMAIAGKVYDFSQFIPKHPAPPATMVAWCGKDATEGMKTKGYGKDHSPVAWAMAETYRIGVLKTD